MGRIFKRDKERGASLVEFAFVLPFLLLLILGIIEFGFVLGLNNDIKHGAREGARFAAVNGGDNNAIRDYICNAMEPLGGSGIQQLSLALDDDTGVIGGTGSLTVEGDIGSLSGLGLIEVFLPSTLSSTIDFRLEQDADAWSDMSLTTVTCP